MKTFKQILCKLGLHNDCVIIKSIDKYGVGLVGAVSQCLNCKRYTKWGKAYYPEHIKKEIRKQKRSNYVQGNNNW
jgi:hypothetical protein